MKQKLQTINTNKVPENKVFATHNSSLNKGSILIFALAFGLYFNSIFNKYSFDDTIVVTSNSFTKQGFAGIPDLLTTDYLTGMYGKEMNMYRGGRYRPLSVVSLAIEYQFFGENPHVSHFINILLFAITCVLLYRLFSKLYAFKYANSFLLLKPGWYSPDKFYLSIPFVATLIYTFHPVHTEAVANIKGRDELMSFLFSLLAMQYAVKWIEIQKIKSLALSVGMYFLALLSKENSVTFFAAIPLTLFYFIPSFVQVNKQKKELNLVAYFLQSKVLTLMIVMTIVTLFFFVLRGKFTGNDEAKITENLMTNPFLEATVSQRYATVFYTLWLYIKLLIFPHPLTFDYYPYHISLLQFSDYRAFLPVIFYLFLGFLAIKSLSKPSLLGYSIWFYLIALSVVSNLLVIVGVFMSERFLYISSWGFCILSAWFLIEKLPFWIQGKSSENNDPKPIYPSVIILLVFLSFYGYKTITRNAVWKDNFTLFTTDVEVSDGSLKSTAAAGEALLNKARKTTDVKERNEHLKKSIRYFTTTVKVYPQYIYVLVYLGECYWIYNQDYDQVANYFLQVLKIDKNYEAVYTKLEEYNKVYQDVDKKIKLYEQIYQINKDRYEINYQLGAMYGAFKNNLEKAIFYLERAIKINDKNPKAFIDLGVAYGIAGNFVNAVQMFEIAYKLDSTDVDVVRNLVYAYEKLKNKSMQEFYERKLALIDVKKI